MPLLVPDSEIKLPPAALAEWQTVCDALARLVRMVSGSTRMHAKWELKFDIGETLDLCKRPRTPEETALGLPADVVDGVMIGIERATPTPVEQQKIGGGTRFFQFDWELAVNVWSLKGYFMGSPADNSRLRLMRQCRDATAIIMMHRGAKGLGLDEGRGMIRQVGMLRWESIDVYGFGEGADVEIAQGEISVLLREQFQAPA